MREEGSPSFFNPEEIFHVLEYMKQLIDHGIDEDDIGVITPYRRQVQKLKRRLEDRGWGDVTVGTTEEFQGQERKVIIVSTVRSNPEFVNLDLKHRLGFLADAKRFNVSITRSRALLIIVGNPFILSRVMSLFSPNIFNPSLFRTSIGRSSCSTPSTLTVTEE